MSAMKPVVPGLDRMIYKIAQFWIKFIPNRSCLEFEDLVQECYLEHVKAQKRFDESKGVKYTTYLYKALWWRCSAIAKTELKYKNREFDNPLPQKPSVPEDDYLVYEGIWALSLLSKSFADMIINGIPDTLFKHLRQHAEDIKERNGWKNGFRTFRLNKTIVERFFGISISKLRHCYYNYNRDDYEVNFLTMEGLKMEEKRLKGFASAVGISWDDSVDMQEQILDAIDDMGEKEWKELPENIRAWSNKKNKEAAAAAKASKPTKAKDKDELKKAKDGAKEKAEKKKAVKKQSKEYPTRFKEGTNGHQITAFVEEAGSDGISITSLIKKCEKAKVNSPNVSGRVRHVMRMCTTIEVDPHCGLLRKDNDLFFWVGPKSETDAEKPAKPAKKEKKEEKKPAKKEKKTKKFKKK